MSLRFIRSLQFSKYLWFPELKIGRGLSFDMKQTELNAICTHKLLSFIRRSYPYIFIIIFQEKVMFQENNIAFPKNLYSRNRFISNICNIIDWVSKILEIFLLNVNNENLLEYLFSFLYNEYKWSHLIVMNDYNINHTTGPPNTFFLENALKKTVEYFRKFLFLFESTILPVNNRK